MERLLEVKDLSISFGGIKAVQDLNFHIDKGEVLALISQRFRKIYNCKYDIRSIYPE